jgi:hypothetical protein
MNSNIFSACDERTSEVQVVRLVHDRNRLRRLREVSQVASQQVLGRAEE